MQAACRPYAPPAHTHSIIKLGGSAITAKQQPETLKPEVLSSVCRTLKQLYDQLREGASTEGFVVVHGAGSFGHFEASQYSITRPLDTPQPTLLEGFARTRLSVTRLNHLVVSALIEAGLPAVGISAFGSCFSHNGSLHPAWVVSYLDAVQASLCAGLVPVLHGDGILEAAGPPLPEPQGPGRYREAQITPAILSGDRIMLLLAQQLHPKCAVFLTDVPGVLTKPPGHPGAQLIPRVVVDKDTGALQFETPAEQQTGRVQMTTAEHDTTGGIAAKLQAAADIARAIDGPVIIAEAGTEAGAAAVLQAPAGSSSSTSRAVAGAGGGQPPEGQQPMWTVVACL